MKKLLCMVLTLALVLVSVAALAESITVSVSSEGAIDASIPVGSKGGSNLIVVNVKDVVYGDSTDNSQNSGIIGDSNTIDESVTTEETTTTTTTEYEGSYNGATKGASDKKSGGSGSKSSSGSKGSSAAGTDAADPGIEIIIVDDTAETVALKNEFAAAIKAGDPKTALPENVASKLSADLKTVNEFVTAKLVGDVSNIASATVNVKFPTKYATSDKAVVLFGIPAGGSTNWITVNGVIESDGSITMVLNSSVLNALAGKTFAMVVLSK